MTARLLGIGGYAGSGKDTVADHLVAKHGFIRDAFADRLRKGLLALNPCIIEFDGHPVRLATVIEEMGWDQAKRKYPEVRALQQRYGTEAGRKVHGENCWVDAWFRDNNRGWASLVVPDCRFSNELAFVRAKGGTLLWVERPGVGPVNAHASDNSVGPADFDHTVVNDGTLEELYAKVDQLMEVL